MRGSSSIDYWNLGAVFLNNYYMVFDTTPHEKFGLNYLQIGINKVGISYTTNIRTSFFSITLGSILLPGITCIVICSLYLGIILIRNFVLNKNRKRLVNIIKHVDDDDYIQKLIKKNKK